MTKIDEEMEQRKCFSLCEVDSKVRASRPSMIPKLSVSGFVCV